MVLWWIRSTFDLKICTVALAVKSNIMHGVCFFRAYHPSGHGMLSAPNDLKSKSASTTPISSPPPMWVSSCANTAYQILQNLYRFPVFVVACCAVSSTTKKHKFCVCLFTWCCLNLIGPKPSYDFWLVSEWPNRLSHRFHFVSISLGVTWAFLFWIQTGG